MNINIVKTHPDAVVPQYATSGAACFDLVSVAGGEVTAGGSVVFDTGLQFEVPEGHVMVVHSRSGHGFKHGIRLINCVGVLDSDYRGNLFVKLRNDGVEPFTVAAGDRIAQAMIIPVFTVGFTVCDELSDTARGAGGFGSTGTAATRTNGDLKVGQRVRLSPDSEWVLNGYDSNPINTDGEVKDISSVVFVEWVNGTRNFYSLASTDLIPQ